MTVSRIPSGTRGASTPPRVALRILMPIMKFLHRRTGHTFRGRPVLYLTTVGAKTGQRRTFPVGRFVDGKGGWLIGASFGGAARHPGWYHNIVARPDQVWAEVDGTTHRVRVEQLAGADRAAAWAVITRESPSFLEYEQNTDREIPVLRLLPVDQAVFTKS